MPVSRFAFLSSKAVAASATVALCLLFVVTGILWQSQVHINHDVAWIAHSAAWLLDGERFGTDILDPNPPLAWFLMLPAAALVRWGVLSEVAAVQSWNWFLTLAGLSLGAYVLLPMVRVIGRIPVIGLLVTSVAVATILPVGNFGQRDVLAFLLTLPYLYSMMGRAVGAPATGPWRLLLIGFAAGSAFCLKPFLLALPVLLELLQLALSRNFRTLIRSETVAMAVTVLGYAAAILLFARDYLDFALPLVRAVYWAYDDSGRLILERFRDSTLPAAYGLAIALVTLSFNRLHAVLVAAIAGFAISFWAQGKGFPYHAYPMLGASCLFLVFAIIQGAYSIRRSTLVYRPAGKWLVAFVLLLLALPALRQPFSDAYDWYQRADRTEGEWGRSRQAVIDHLRSLGVGPSDYLYAISTHPNPGFPTVNYLGARWSGRTVTQFAVPAHVRRSEVQDPALLREIDRAIALQGEIIVGDLLRHPPSYVMVEARQWRLGLAFRKFDDLAFHQRDPAFARIWDCYTEIESSDQIRLFKRRDECRTN